MREEKEPAVEYENCSYLAVKVPGSTTDYQELDKNEIQSYLYLTKDRSKAAVFTWKQLQANLPSKAISMQETPLRWISHLICNREWIFLKPGEVLSTEAVKKNLRYKFDEEDNALYEIKKVMGPRPKKHKAFVGTWTVHLDSDSIKKIGSRYCCNVYIDKKETVNSD